ncbi:MAG: BrnA antitoxin family protein [Magnetococcales bacterium]|nr:BrnA antitoxin family protein [Magnetococcales bacterium]
MSTRKMKIEMPTPEEDAAITAAALLDLDNPPLNDLELLQFKRVAGRPKTLAPKVSTTIRFDADVINGFRATGKGWQTRMNDALRDWLKSHSPA